MAVIEDRVQLKAGQYASLFISERPLDPPGYSEAMGEVMAEAEKMRGYLGFEALRRGPDFFVERSVHNQGDLPHLF